MTELFTSPFDTSGFPPRWTCGRWTPEHGWLHIGSDVAIWAAYLAIPCVLGYFVAGGSRLPFRWVFALFGAFILLCGTTHLIEAVIFWWPVYRLAGWVKLATAVVSWATVLALVRVAPRALALRSPEELEREVAERRRAEDELRVIQADLEQRVAVRTAELAAANDALRTSEARVSAILGTVVDGILTIDEQGRIESLNPAAERLFGVTAADALGRNVNSLMPEPYRSEHDGYLAAYRRSGVPRVIGIGREVTGRRRDGSEFPIELSVSETRLADGRRLFTGIVRDITRRKAAEEEVRRLTAGLEQRVADRTAALEAHAAALARSEQAVRDNARLLQAILNSLGEGVVVADTGGRFLYFNLAAEELLGRRAADLPPDDWSAYYQIYRPDGDAPVPPADLPLVRAMAGGASGGNTYVIRLPDGGSRFITMTGSPLGSDDGSLSGGVAVIRDITDLREAEAALRESDRRLQLAVTASNLGVCEWLVPTDSLYWSPECLAILGPPPPEPGLAGYLSRVHPADAARVRAGIELAAGGPATFASEYRVVRPGGEVRWVAQVGRAEPARAGGPRRMICTLQDVTDRKEVELRLRNSLHEKQVLLREVHHRVKNNLQVICSLLDLQGNYLTSPSAAGKFAEARDRVRAMALVHERLYRSENLSRLDLAEYARGLVENVAVTYPTRAVRFDLDLSPVFLPIDVAVPCGLILNELLSNCLKHAFGNQEDCCVTVVLSRTEAGITLVVADNGAASLGPTTFTSPKSFGLRLVAALVDQIHGTVGVTGGAGTSVRVTFPDHAPVGDRTDP